MGHRRRPLGERRLDRAWREFRRQLADYVATIEDHEILQLLVQVGTEEEERHGAAPYVQLVGWGGGELVRAEACSNHYLDDRYLLDAHAEQALAEAGWSAPTFAPDGDPDGGSANWWTDHELRHADLVAHRATVALRDAFGCPHPSFVRVEGRLVLTGAAAAAGEASAEARAEAVDDAEEPLRHPRGVHELRQMVVEALERMVQHPVELDDDGDVPLPTGRSLLYVQALEDEPTVRLWARLVTDVDDRLRAADEVAMTNRDLLFGAVVLTDSGCIDFHHHLCAAPFVPQQLRAVVARVLLDLDRRASDFLRRVGGHRFLDDLPPVGPVGPVGATAAAAEVVGRAEPGHRGEPRRRPAADEERSLPPQLLVLRELLDAGAADPRTVAAVWDGDLHALALEIDDLRTEPPAVLDVADAIAALREALVFVVERRSKQRWSRPTRSPGRRPRSQQDELIPSRELGEATLDLGSE